MCRRNTLAVVYVRACVKFLGALSNYVNSLPNNVLGQWTSQCCVIEEVFQLCHLLHVK